MANSFIHVPPGYEGPSDFQVAAQNEINQGALKYTKVNIQNDGHTYGALERSRTLERNRLLEGLVPAGRPTDPIQPRVPRPGYSQLTTRHIQPRTPDPGYSLPSVSSVMSPSSGSLDEDFTDRTDASKIPTNTASMYQPASSLLRRQSDSDDEYDEDSELEQDLALMRVSSRRPAGEDLEPNLDVKEALDVPELSNAEKALVENITSGKYPRLTLPTRNKVATSDAKDKTVKTGGDGEKKTKSVQAALERKIATVGDIDAVETHTQVILPSQVKPPTHARVVIPITDEEAAEENPEESPYRSLGGPVQNDIRILSHRSHVLSSRLDAPPPP
jgi:hypothetical protein